MKRSNNTAKKALNQQDLSLQEALDLYLNWPLTELAAIAHELRCIKKPETDKVTWLIDRNVNITNVCCSQCAFCNFYRKRKSLRYAVNLEVISILNRVDKEWPMSLIIHCDVSIRT